MNPSLTVAKVRGVAHVLGYRPTHTTRMVHEDYLGEDGTEMRTAHRNSATLEANQGVAGPIAFEITYGSGTVRVRGFYGAQMIGLVDFTAARYAQALVEMRDLDAQMRGLVAADRRKFSKGKR